MTDDRPFKHIPLEKAIACRKLYGDKRQKEIDKLYISIGIDINTKLDHGSSENYVLSYFNPSELVIEALKKHVEVMNSIGYKVVLKHDKGDLSEEYELVISLGSPVQ